MELLDRFKLDDKRDDFAGTSPAASASCSRWPGR